MTALIDGIHHVTMLTADMTRLVAFYELVFGARLTSVVEERGVRHAQIQLGGSTVLHPFQIPGLELRRPDLPRLRSGRLDHFGLQAADEHAFRELRRRVVAAGAGDGVVVDTGAALSFGFKDPDGGEHQITCARPGVPVPRAAWREVEIAS
jgi:catechol 2,3-dioxygenase-like lactoylglutathione lyase family enzyme